MKSIYFSISIYYWWGTDTFSSIPKGEYFLMISKSSSLLTARVPINPKEFTVTVLSSSLTASIYLNEIKTKYLVTNRL